MSDPAPLGLAQLAVPPLEPPVPVLPLTTGTTLVMETSNAPTVVAVLPAATWICISTGVPSVPVLVHVAVGTIGGRDQLGHVTSAKHTVAVMPFVKAGYSLKGATAPDGGVALCVKPMRTTLPPLLPVSVMTKHFEEPV